MKALIIGVFLALLLSLNDIGSETNSRKEPEFRFNCTTAKGIAEMELYLEDDTIKAICDAVNN